MGVVDSKARKDGGRIGGHATQSHSKSKYQSMANSVEYHLV